ncbi:hypothetical protein BH10ACI2_BH10ACI2_05560 [soil metagenome]
MKKALFYRLFGVGKLPAKFAPTFAAEGIVLFDEGLGGSLTYRNFHRPGSYSGLRKVGMTASIVVTNKRLAAYNGENPVIDVPFSDERLKQIAFSVEPSGALLAAFDASLFHDDWTGSLEYRFKTPLAQEMVDKINSLAIAK